jgi:methyltransferase (TIGR00027 family)
VAARRGEAEAVSLCYVTQAPSHERVLAGVSATALWTAYCRAEETRRHEPLVVDPLAERLCGHEGMAIGRAFEAQGGAHDAIVVRTAMIDERLQASLARGVRHVVSLGAGLCARPHRLPVPRGTRFVEVDLPATLEWKERHLGALPAPAGVSITRFAGDLACDADLDAPLRAVEGAPLAVVLEGVVQYLEGDHVRALFSRLARRGAETTIVCDVGGGAWSRLFARRIPEAVARGGAPYVTRIENPRAFFEPLGFRVASDTALVDWDAARPAPRFVTPWTARLIPGFRASARVLELVIAH